jgi:hypothetical protein
MLLKINDSVQMMELPTAVANTPIDLNITLINSFQAISVIRGARYGVFH